MTIICWDGKTMAADRQSTDGGMRRQVTKVHRAKDGSLMATSGDAAVGNALRAWYDAGAVAADYPDKDKRAWLLVVGLDRQIRYYDAMPLPILFAGQRFAMGSGRDFAEAAMYFGKTAREAVEVACHFDSACGCGIDSLDLE